MAIQYTTEQKNGYLLIRAEGVTDDPNELINYVDALLKEAESRKSDKFLLDHRDLRFERQNLGTYDVAVRCVDKLNKNRTLKVAMLSRPERLPFAKVYETIALTGQVQIRVFDKMTMAIAWLTAKH